MTALPDGADRAAYLYLSELDRAGLMWEWLRRDPAYIGWYVRASRATAGCLPAPLRFRLLLAEDPALPAPAARILWRADLDPAALVVRARTTRGRDPEALPLQRLRPWLSLARGRDGREHAVLSDGRHHLRLDVEEGTLGEGPVLLHYRLPRSGSWDAAIGALRRLRVLCVERRFPSELFPSEPHPERWIELLRASDALRAGASQRDVAELVFGIERTRAEWHGPSESLRSRVRRLIGEVSRLAAGGYRRLMRDAEPGERRRQSRSD